MLEEIFYAWLHLLGFVTLWGVLAVLACGSAVLLGALAWSIGYHVIVALDLFNKE